MFESIQFYRIVDSWNVENICYESKILTAKKRNNIHRQVEGHGYVCIPPKAFEDYPKLISEQECFRKYGDYYNDDIEDEDCILYKTLSPIEQTIDQFVFLRLEITASETKFKIVEEFKAADIFAYWFKKNHFTKLNALRHLGLTENIFNLLPNHSNYYDQNTICNCGYRECGNTEVWYVKYIDSFAIPFMICTLRRIVFDFGYFDEETSYLQEDDYNEDSYPERRSYNKFPFCFEAKKI
jgi:hypothetical protein